MNSLDDVQAKFPPFTDVEITMDSDTEPFWLAAKEGVLTACQCATCEQFRMPPTPYCPHCLSSERSWPALPGTGRVFSFVVCNRHVGEDIITYVPAVIDIDGAPGARLIANLGGCAVSDINIGMPVEVQWSEISGGWLLPNFSKASG